TPALRAASMRLVSAGTSTCWPLTVSLGMRHGLAPRRRGGRALGQRLELAPELLDVRDVRADRAVVERADRRAGAATRHVEDRVQVCAASPSLHDPVGHLVDPAGRLPARRALAAALVGVEA